MTAIFSKTINRRDFLKTSLTIVGVLGSGCAGFRFPQPKDRGKVARWAFLADSHISADVNDNYRGFYPYQNLEKVVAEINSCSPDGVVIAGDLARLEGKLDDYNNLKKLLAPLAEKTPVFLALGNHDDRNNFLQIFDNIPGERQSIKDKLVVVVYKPPIRLIILDSLFYVNKAPGLLGKAQRQWLQNYLKSCDDTPTILCFHHTLGDHDGDLLDVPRLFDIIKPIKKVKAIVYGHSHEYHISLFEGIHLINLPAVGYNFSDKEPLGWMEARLTAKGGDFILHAIGGTKEKNGSIKKLTWRR
jgi:predicted MPP superfamily phosphohydrolase